MSSDAAIRVHDVSKHYLMYDRPEDRLKQMVVPRLQALVGRPPRRYFQDFAALSHVSFEIGRGETIGIIGRNGSGKSTLLQIICGTLRPSGGTVEVNGRIAALLELGAGFNPEFTGRENVYLNAAILGLSREETEARFDDIAAFADIGPFLDQPVKTYSSGMYVRLAFAVAINVDPDILIVDEALAVGDEAFQRKCFARIEDIQANGGTILFVSHGAQTIVQLCSRAMLIDHGELLLEGRPKTVVSQYHRLVHASPSAQDDTRQVIKALASAADEEPEGPDAATSASSQTSRDRKDEEDAAGDVLSPELRSHSVLALEENGAKIHSCSVTTTGGKEVNILKMGRRYIAHFTVDFTVEAARVGFGMQITTLAGVGLAGLNTSGSPYQRLQEINPGQKQKVSIEFTCNMLPGTYLMSFGVHGNIMSKPVLMHRIGDALLFRVAPESGLYAVGMVSIEHVVRTSQITDASLSPRACHGRPPQPV